MPGKVNLKVTKLLYALEMVVCLKVKKLLCDMHKRWLCGYHKVTCDALEMVCVRSWKMEKKVYLKDLWKNWKRGI